MAPLSTKRRKLEHNNDDTTSDFSDGAEGVNLAEGDSQPEPQTQVQAQPQPGPRRTRDDDDSTIYAGEDFKSSLFKLQVDELLTEVQPNYEKRLKGVDDLLRKLKGLIEGIEDRDATSVSAFASLGAYSD